MRKIECLTVEVYVWKGEFFDGEVAEIKFLKGKQVLNWLDNHQIKQFEKAIELIQENKKDEILRLFNEENKTNFKEIAIVKKDL